MGFNVGTAMLYDVETGKRTLKMESKVFGFTGILSLDGRWAIVGNTDSGPPSSCLDLKEKRIHHLCDMDPNEKKAEFLAPLIFSPDGKTVLVQKIKGREYLGVALCDIETLKIRKEIPDPKRIISTAFTPNGERLILLDNSDRLEDPTPRQIRCWDIKASKEIWRIPERSYQFNRILSAPGGDLALLIPDTFPGRMALISTKTGKTISFIRADFPERGNFPDPANKP